MYTTPSPDRIEDSSAATMQITTAILLAFAAATSTAFSPPPPPLCPEQYDSSTIYNWIDPNVHTVNFDTLQSNATRKPLDGIVPKKYQPLDFAALNWTIPMICLTSTCGVEKDDTASIACLERSFHCMSHQEFRKIQKGVKEVEQCEKRNHGWGKCGRKHAKALQKAWKFLRWGGVRATAYSLTYCRG
ncbi:hypothetical protein K461DRAFT_265474 [Myriangium duriaei CBS 260.36]|uniref:Uncharacterized protein n=1 Tax=Myriangium duriaei CBS 260.36 TaxID=1168546 RepID=A0A9P4J786_9PEZI|nr:hypothetical protein K461DRAFT_265474 [Myriangium duriaei CBS 260.36]